MVKLHVVRLHVFELHAVRLHVVRLHVVKLHVVRLRVVRLHVYLIFTLSSVVLTTNSKINFYTFYGTLEVKGRGKGYTKEMNSNRKCHQFPRSQL